MVLQSTSGNEFAGSRLETSTKTSAKAGKEAFGKRDVAVTAYLFDSRLQSLKFDSDHVGLNFRNIAFHLNTVIHILGGYDYHIYKERWSAGFQTDKEWGTDFSYSLSYKQKDEIGDARTNWELNRHFQFALLAKAYYATGEEKYAKELEGLFLDWNKKILFSMVFLGLV